jgi:hypothetical protein
LESRLFNGLQAIGIKKIFSISASGQNVFDRSAFHPSTLLSPQQGGWVSISRKYTGASWKRQGFVRRSEKQSRNI